MEIRSASLEFLLETYELKYDREGGSPPSHNVHTESLRSLQSQLVLKQRTHQPLTRIC